MEFHGLPHRDPFVFVDSVVARVGGESAVCERRFSADDPLFSGHFPGNPIVPGVLLTEALAQTAGIAGAADGRGFLLSAIRSMKFPSAARPEETIVLSAVKVGELGGLLSFGVKATVGDRVVADGQVVLTEVGT
jgi:3-hydroxyacyl-[acyl-carrier-protein] dehydratase